VLGVENSMLAMSLESDWSQKLAEEREILPMAPWQGTERKKR